jgi:hypothetical protein
VQLEIRWINSTHRTKYNRHGIKLLFLQSGIIADPDPQTALIQLVSALGLTAVASLVGAWTRCVRAPVLFPHALLLPLCRCWFQSRL